MKKVLLGVVGVLVLAVGGVSAAAMMQPDIVHVERSATMNGTVADVHPYISDFKQINAWSPWADMDPEQKTTFSDPSSGVNAWYEWQGNDQVGHGKLVMTGLTETESVQKLEFYAPWQSVAEVRMIAAPAGDDKVKVTWTYDQDADFSTKLMGLFMSMDDMLGGQYEDGLAMLVPMVESAAQARVQAEAEQAAAEAKAAEEAQAAAEGADTDAAVE